MKLFIVWKKPNNEYYHKVVNGFYKNYTIGYTNSYNHKIVEIIKIPTIHNKMRYRLINRIIRFLEKLKTKL